MNRHFCTIVSYSHLPLARALAESLRASGNPEPLHVLVTDITPGEIAEERTLTLIPLSTLSPRIPAAMVRYFDAFELCNALKPFLISHLIEDLGSTHVIYLDADLWITGRFDTVWAELDTASLLLTPHQLTPPPLDLPVIDEIAIVDLGFLNGGFSAWRAGPEAARILAWMSERLPVYGFCDRSRCMFVDQKLLPLLLSYFPLDARILRDPGLNVAYWNAHERHVSRADRWLAGTRPVVFFHLSGYNLARPDKVCSYMPAAANARLLQIAPWFRELVGDYHACLSRHHAAHPARPYGHARFQGIELNRPLRTLLYREGRIDRATAAYWRIRIVESLRLAKRRLKRLTKAGPSP